MAPYEILQPNEEIQPDEEDAAMNNQEDEDSSDDNGSSDDPREIKLPGKKGAPAAQQAEGADLEEDDGTGFSNVKLSLKNIAFLKGSNLHYSS